MENTPLKSLLEAVDQFGKITIRTKVITAAKQNCICEFLKENDIFNMKIKTNAIAEKGKANTRIITYLSKELHLPKCNIQITSGTLSNHKTIIISQ